MKPEANLKSRQATKKTTKKTNKKVPRKPSSSKRRASLSSLTGKSSSYTGISRLAGLSKPKQKPVRSKKNGADTSLLSVDKTTTETEKGASANTTVTKQEDHYKWWYTYLNSVEEQFRHYQQVATTASSGSALGDFKSKRNTNNDMGVQVSRKRPSYLQDLNTQPKPPTPPSSPPRITSLRDEGRMFVDDTDIDINVNDIKNDPYLLGADFADDDIDLLSRSGRRGATGKDGWLQDQIDFDIKALLEKHKNGTGRGQRQKLDTARLASLGLGQGLSPVEDEQLRVLNRIRQTKLDLLIRKEKRHLRQMRERELLETERRAAARLALEDEATYAMGAQKRRTRLQTRRAKALDEQGKTEEYEHEAKLKESKLDELLTFAKQETSIISAGPNRKPGVESYHWAGGPGSPAPRLRTALTGTYIDPRPVDPSVQELELQAAERSRQEVIEKARQRLVLSLAGDEAKVILGELTIALEIGLKEDEAIVAAARNRIKHLTEEGATKSSLREAERRLKKREMEAEQVIRLKDVEVRQSVLEAKRQAEEKAKKEKDELQRKAKEQIEQAREAARKAREHAANEEKRLIAQRQELLETKLKELSDRQKERERLNEIGLQVAQLATAHSQSRSHESRNQAEALLFAERTERLREEVKSQLQATRETMMALQSGINESKIQGEKTKEVQLAREASLLEALEIKIQQAVEGALQSQTKNVQDEFSSSDISSDSLLSTDGIGKVMMSYDDLRSEGEIIDSSSHVVLSPSKAGIEGFSDGEITPDEKKGRGNDF